MSYRASCVGRADASISGPRLPGNWNHPFNERRQSHRCRNRPLKRVRICNCWMRVDFDDDSLFWRQLHQICRRVNKTRCTYDQQQVALANLPGDLMHDRWIQAFPEPDHSRSHIAAAVQASGRRQPKLREQRLLLHLSAGPAAGSASRGEQASMQMQHIDRTGALVQIVNVLRHDLRATAHLQLSYGVVAAIGFSCHHHPTAPLVPTPDHGLVVLPGGLCGKLLGIELIPKAIAAGSESRNSTVGRHASAAKDNYALEAMGRQRLCDFFGDFFFLHQFSWDTPALMAGRNSAACTERPCSHILSSGHFWLNTTPTIGRAASRLPSREGGSCHLEVRSEKSN